MLFDGRSILITGGTGSLGKVLLRRILSGEKGEPYRILIFSRDEAKQSALKTEYEMEPNRVLREKFKEIVKFQIGDIRDYWSVATAIQGINIVFNAAALKQVPACEYQPYEAVRTNIEGAENIVRAIEKSGLHHPSVMTVIGISTDKACKPVNVMGMTKAIQERIFLSARDRCPHTDFVCVRYGNVLASRGSVVPLFKEQIKRGGPVTLTTNYMTRFLLSLDQAVDTVFEAVQSGRSGETYVPKIDSAYMIDVAGALIENKVVDIEVIGIRPGEKIHEILVSEDEAPRTIERNGYYVISSVLSGFKSGTALTKEFSSEDVVMGPESVKNLLGDNGLL